jgi:hypothetical protein
MVSAFDTAAGAWMSPFTTTKTPFRPEAATRSAAARLAGPSLEMPLIGRIAPVTTTGMCRLCTRDSA